MAGDESNQLANTGDGAGGANDAGALTAAQQQEQNRLIAALRATGISAANFKAPMFWESSPRTWFNRLESAFVSSNITSNASKVNHLIAHLPEDVGRSVQHYVEEKGGRAQPTYPALKEIILDARDMPLSQRLAALLELRSLGDLRPSQMATHILQ